MPVYRGSEGTAPLLLKLDHRYEACPESKDSSRVGR